MKEAQQIEFRIAGENPVENLNNAIALIDIKAANDPKTPKGSRKAVHDMAVHWGKFWNSSERRLMPDVALKAKLDRYVKWYTRAWHIVSPDVQAKVDRPDRIDTSYSALALQMMRNWEEGAQDAAKAGVASAEYIAKGAAELSQAAAMGARGVVSDLATIGMVGLVAYYLLKK